MKRRTIESGSEAGKHSQRRLRILLSSCVSACMLLPAAQASAVVISPTEYELAQLQGNFSYGRTDWNAYGEFGTLDNIIEKADVETLLRDGYVPLTSSDAGLKNGIYSGYPSEGFHSIEFGFVGGTDRVLTTLTFLSSRSYSNGTGITLEYALDGGPWTAAVSTTTGAIGITTGNANAYVLAFGGVTADAFRLTLTGAQVSIHEIGVEVTEVCGDGLISGSEQCDDGNTDDGDCCSSTCQSEAVDSPCEDGQFCTVNDQCNETGACIPGTARTCTDSDNCTVDSCSEDDDACLHASTPRDPASCLVAPGTKLQIKDSATAGKDRLSWQWGKGEAFAQVDLGTPLVATTYTLCVYDKTASMPSLAGSIEIAASPTLWVSKDPKGLQYKDKAGTSDGVTKAQLKTGDDGKTKVKVSATGLNLALPAPAGSTYFDQDPNVVVQLVNSTGKCWTSEFAPADTKTNEADSFKAQTK